MIHQIIRRFPFLVAPIFLMLTSSIAANETNMGQGWSNEERQQWYSATQGSRLLPLSWFDALEQSDNTKKFKESDNLASFGFLTSDVPNAFGLPIGFAVDQQNDTEFVITGLRWYDGQRGGKNRAEKWIGLNCAACHTTQMTVANKTLTIDGGANLLDFQMFIEQLDLALGATALDSDKFDRFATKVLTGRDTSANRAKLKTALSKLVSWQRKTDVMNETPMRYGFGRLDAVGHILNKVLMFNGADASAGNPANAPVSYPFLWNIWRQKQVQWNGVAENSRIEIGVDAIEYGALGRNTGEVLGVFGEIRAQPRGGILSSFQGFKSSIQVSSLDSLENMLKRLQQPTWPDTLAVPEPLLVEEGKVLFAKKCASCHKTPDLQKHGEKTERMVTFEETLKNNPEDLTDIWMACNAWNNEGPTGSLKGIKDGEGIPFGDTAPVANMLEVQIKGALLGKKASLVGVAARNFLGVKRPPVVVEAGPLDKRQVERKRCLTTPNQPLLAYKARPLDGIWATAPYLHNGSVASLYELLLPANERMQSFWVGNREFDEKHVGYKITDPGNGMGFLFQVRDANGAIIDGNNNAGHEYGAKGFSETQRQALIAYMKTL